MGYKIATYIVLILIMALGVSYWISAYALKGMGVQVATTLGPGYFPRLLAIALLILCVISFIQTAMRTKSDKFEIPNIKIVLFTIVVLSIFISSWYFLDYFYVNLFIFLLVLFNAYRLKGLNKKLFLINSMLALAITVVLYILFGLVMTIRL